MQELDSLGELGQPVVLHLTPRIVRVNGRYVEALPIQVPESRHARASGWASAGSTGKGLVRIARNAILAARHTGEEGRGLNGLAETHVVLLVWK